MSNYPTILVTPLFAEFFETPLIKMTVYINRDTNQIKYNSDSNIKNCQKMQYCFSLRLLKSLQMEKILQHYFDPTNLFSSISHKAFLKRQENFRKAQETSGKITKR